MSGLLEVSSKPDDDPGRRTSQGSADRGIRRETEWS